MMAVIKASGLAGLMAWSGARVTAKGDIEIPAEDKARFEDFRKYIGQCDDVSEYTISYLPGSLTARATVTLKAGAVLPRIA